MQHLRASIEAIVVALNERDAYTRFHCARVSELALALGTACKLDRKDIETLGIAAAFHDIGKIGIRDNVLLKPAKLDADEWDHMKSHPARGERIFRSADLDCGDAVAPFIRHHHEAFDGNGYPDGLTGEAIPVACRILLVVDSYDAMTTTRPYQKARSHDETMEILRGESGTKLDPAVVATFERVIAQHPMRA